MITLLWFHQPYSMKVLWELINIFMTLLINWILCDKSEYVSEYHVHLSFLHTRCGIQQKELLQRKKMNCSLSHIWLRLWTMFKNFQFVLNQSHLWDKFHKNPLDCLNVYVLDSLQKTPFKWRDSYLSQNLA